MSSKDSPSQRNRTSQPARSPSRTPSARPASRTTSTRPTSRTPSARSVPRPTARSRSQQSKRSPRQKWQQTAASGLAGAAARFPRGRIVVLVLCALIALALLGFIADLVSTTGKIHAGVTVQGVDVGGLSRADAAALLEDELGATVTALPIELYATTELATAGPTEGIVELDHASTSYQTGSGEEDDAVGGGQAWRITATTVGAAIDGEALAEEAYGVGRGADLLTGRLHASFLGVKLPARLSYDPSQLSGLESLLDEALGWQVVNADIRFEDGNFVVMPGSEGLGIDHAALVEALDQAFLAAEPARVGVVAMTPIPVLISDDEAALAAARAQEAIAQPVALVYLNEDSWNLDSYSLGSWVATSIEGEGDAARLVCSISADWLADGLRDIIGERDPGIKPQNARFEVVDDRVTVVPSVNGTGVDYARVAGDLGGILFPAGEPVKDRRVTLAVSTLEPSFSTEQANDLHITDKIASYTTEYSIASNAKVTNIHLASDLINNSLLAPGDVWSFNDTAGECNAQRGFQEATSIVQGEYVDEIGGGICQVATTVFNAVFDSGLPIVERVNHGFYLIAYPAGRDATVSWRWPDLKFENDTGNWLLLTMSYTDSSVTCTLWGTDPGYTVESESTGSTDRTDFETKRIDNPELPKDQEKLKQEGVRGRTIVVTRFVYNSAGELIRKTAFKSVYEPETEIIEVGTKEEEKTENSGG